MRHLITGFFALAMLAPLESVMAKDLSIYISADMEGTVGVVTADQLSPEGFEYARFRGFMTDEVNAAIEAATAAGATRIVVSDSHGNGENLLIEKLPRNVLVVRAWPRPLGMMQGIEEGKFDGAIFLGYHTATTNMKGVRAHTWSSALLTAAKLNGQPVSEAAVNAVIAGHFGVPVIMISGDSEVIKETRDLLGDVEGAAVKWPYGFHSALTMTPEAANNAIREKVTAAMKRIKSFKPHKVEGPMVLELSFKNYAAVEFLSYLPIVDRIDSHTIRYKADNIIDISKFVDFVLHYSPDLKP